MAIRYDSLGRRITFRKPFASAITQPPPPPGDWIDDAACPTIDPAEADRIFFPLSVPGDQGRQSRRLTIEAKLICDDCPVIHDCADYAIVNGIEHGIWGGTSPEQRRRLRGKRTR